MKRAIGADGLDRFQRYRMGRRARGLKLIRVWVADPRAPGFAAEARRQASLLRDAPEEQDALAFIEASADWHGDLS